MLSLHYLRRRFLGKTEIRDPMMSEQYSSKNSLPVLGLWASHLSDTNFPLSVGKIYLEMQLNSFEIYLLCWVKDGNLIYLKDRS